MNAFFKPYSSLFVAASLFIAGCSDTDDVKKPSEPKGPGQAGLHLDSRFGDQDFELNKMLPLSATDSVEVTGLQYYISNITMARTDGGRYTETESYHLVRKTSALTTEEFTLKNIPAGEYNKITFLVGVDEAHNKSHDFTEGDLSVHGPMAWFWNTSFVFLKADGFYNDAAAAGRKSPFAYEIGKDQNSRWVSLSFPKNIIINEENSPNLHLYADVKKLFTSPNAMDLKASPEVKGNSTHDANATKVADNYSQMFRIDHIH